MRTCLLAIYGWHSFLTRGSQQALSGLSTLFTWGSICMCHIRFRKAWKVQGHSIDELPFRAWGGVYGSWLGFTLVCLVLIAQFYTAVCELASHPTRDLSDGRVAC